MPSNEIGLNAHWKLGRFEKGQGEIEGAHLSDFDASDWLDADVPGDINLDLWRAGEIGDPLDEPNRAKEQWIAHKEWWYRQSFIAPERFSGKRVELYFGGLNANAAVWVNGKLAGEHSNMFAHYTLDVTNSLAYGRRNSVAVCFSPAESKQVRKIQDSPMTTLGIWRPVYLIAKGAISIENPVIKTTAIEDNRAILNLEIPIANNSKRKNAKLQISLADQKGFNVVSESLRMNLNSGDQIIEKQVVLPNPKLWRPWNVGKPEMYRLSVNVVAGEDIEDTRHTKFGVRTIELLTDEDGSFSFKINGEEIQAKSINWMPPNAIMACTTRKDYRELINLAIAANANMLRVRGDSIYEDPYFYRFCDESGMMVLQDFMLPNVGDLSEIRGEAEKIVRELRNHPSIIAWRGEAEGEILSKVCEEKDPSRPHIAENAEICDKSLSDESHIEAFKEAHERHRRKTTIDAGYPLCNLCDGARGFPNSAVDSSRNPKMEYYAIARAYSNIMVSLEDMGEGLVGVWVVNDEQRDRMGKLLLRCQRLDGGTAWMRMLPVKIYANSSRMVWNMRPPKPLLEEPHSCFAQAQLLLNGRVVSENFHFPVEESKVEFPDANLSARVERISYASGKSRVDLSISSNQYCRLVKVETPGLKSFLSDNYFDIPPGEERPVRITAETDPSFKFEISAMNAVEKLAAEI